MIQSTTISSRVGIVLRSTIAIMLHYGILVGATLTSVRLGQSYVLLTGTWFDHFLQWDGVWYTFIGRYGYHLPTSAQEWLSYLGNSLPIHVVKATAFFPLLPMLVHISGPLGALVITNILFVASVFLLAGWLRRHCRSVGWGVLLFAVNPAGMFLSSLYPASYLVFFTICVMHVSETKHRFWWTALICGYLSSLTTGLGIVIGLFVLAFWLRREWLKGFAYGISVAMGWVTYGFLLVQQGLSPVSFMQAQHVWGRVWRFPLTAWFESFRIPSSIEHWDQIYVAIFLGLLLIQISEWRQTKYIPVSTFVWSMMYTLFCLSTYWIPFVLIGTLRFIGIAFPLYGITSHRANKATITLNVLLLIAFLFAFAIGSAKMTHALVYQ